MNCMKCGAPLTESAYCPECGCDVVVQKQAIVLSELYYNQGLEKAEIRDLSGAIDQLKRSLKFNKLNIPARNLLGLIYFETGEVVAALSEWVISKNIQPEGNIATEYINRLQKDSNKLDTINQTIKKYNQALVNCRQGHEDVAMIQLKKILAQNPKLIKGYHLLALLHIKNHEYEKARKVLKKAIKIDKTNTTTLRFLRDVDAKTGTVTALEPRFSMWSGKMKAQPEETTTMVYQSDNEIVVQPASFKETSIVTTVLTLGAGLLIGAAAIWFLIMPAKTQAIHQEANRKITEYSSTTATQTAKLARLEEEVETSKETVETANQQIQEANQTAASYENLIVASNEYNKGSMETAATALANVNPSLLSVDAKAIYDSIYGNVRGTMFKKYKEAGINAFDYADYDTAITQLTLAMDAATESDYEVMNYLAHAYRLKGDTEGADAAFLAIIEAFPGSRRAVNAVDYLSESARAAYEASGEAAVAPEEAVTANEEGGDGTGEGASGNGSGEASGGEPGDGTQEGASGDGTGQASGEDGTSGVGADE